MKRNLKILLLALFSFFIGLSNTNAAWTSNATGSVQG